MGLAQGGTGCPLCVLCRKCVRAGIGVCGISNRETQSVFSETLLPSLSKQLGWGKIDSLLSSPHLPADFPNSELFEQASPIVLKVSSVGNFGG